jgi:hypothetical protein
VSDKDGETKVLANVASPLQLDTLAVDFKAFQTAVDAKPTKKFNYRKKEPENNDRIPPPAVKAGGNELKLTLKQEDLTGELLNELKDILSLHAGNAKVFLIITNGGPPKIVEIQAQVHLGPEIVKAIKDKFGMTIRISI